MIDYEQILIDKLKAKYPNGLKLYHVTDNAAAESIMKEGMLLSYTRSGAFHHTTLGTYDYGRVTAIAEGFSVIEISIKVEDYGRIYPEEATYWTDECDECEDGDARDIIFCKNYIQGHPDLDGGDITLYDDIEPEIMKVVDVDGVKL